MVETERHLLQRRIGDWLDLPMAILSLIWVGLLVIELAIPLSPEMSGRVYDIDLAIWLIFIVDFALEFTLAPNKLDYLKSNALIALSLVLPFVRVFRVLRLATVLRSISLVRLVLVGNRASAAVADIFSRRGFQYVFVLIAIVTLLSATGVYYFERNVSGSPLRSFGDALWWAATMATTINTSSDPITFEGRLIGLLLRAFAVAVFGYLAASIASYLVEQEVGGQGERRENREEINRLAREVDRLSALLEGLDDRPQPGDRQQGDDS